ncbi:unnamed protein product [Amoebophrya sp. A120]|nr:unnamed protein product [Amoebophrya sp. A120]|eukprot:GSA120T00013283001.1
MSKRLSTVSGTSSNAPSTRPSASNKATSRVMVDTTNDCRKDRMADLRRAAGVTEEEAQLAVEMGYAGDGSEDSVLLPLLSRKKTGAVSSTKVSKITRVLADIEKDINEYLEDLGTLTHNISVFSREMKRAVTREEEAKITNEMKASVDQAKVYNAKVKNCLDDLESLQKTKKNALTTSELDYCGKIIQISSVKFQDSIKSLLNAQSEFDREHKGKMRRQVRILYPEAADAEIEKLLEGEPEVMKTMFEQKFKRGQGGAQVEDDHTLHENLELLKSQHDDMMELEQSVIELNELFFYLAALVEAQAKTLHSIEDSVNKTDNYVGEAVVRLAQAEKSKKAYETKRSWLKSGFGTLMIVGIIIGVVLLFIFCIKPLLDAKSAVTG